MYVVAMAWLYVTFLMALTERSVVAGMLSFAAYGLAPLALLLWLFGIPRRTRDRRRREAAGGSDPPQDAAS
ncbi:MAG: hypothetical protein U1F52_19585 [Burkholderiales bacterium]